MRVLGLDCGIASVGWAVLDIGSSGAETPSYKVVACGVYCFEQPTVGGTGKDKFSSIKSARSKRIGHMQHMRRKKRKLSDLRRLLVEHGLLPSSAKEALGLAMRRVSPQGQAPQITPYDLRAKSLDQILSSDEFAVCLGHIISHPGPRSSTKLKNANDNPERGVIKSAVAANANYAQEGYLTVGQMLAQKEKFRFQKRNRQGDWKYSVGRRDLLDELREIFRSQRKFGNKAASQTLLDAIVEIIERKKEPDAEYFEVENCRFEAGEPRAPSRSISFERFRFAEHLVKLSLTRESGVKLSPEEIRSAMELFAVNTQTSFADLRAHLKLPKDVLFENVKKKDESARDFAAGKGQSCHGTVALREALGYHWQEFADQPAILDEICRILSFATKRDVVETDIGAMALGEPVGDRLLRAYDNGQFDAFVEAARISTKAARNLTPLLEQGDQYSEACKACGYDHTAQTVNPAQNKNPVVRHAVREYLAVIELLLAEHGSFDEIRIEMARDVAWGAEKKLEEAQRNLDNQAANKRLRAECKELLGGIEPTAFQVIKCRLAKEQGCKCIYSGADLCAQIRAGFDGIDVDHILPRGRFNIVGDRRNLAACLTGANANKGKDTPFEWSSRDPEFDWDVFRARVFASKDISKGKRRFLLMQSTQEMEDAFASRNLIDTQYSIRLLIAEFEALKKRRNVSSENPPRIVGRPGRLVSWLRGSWGLGRFKYDLQAKRVSDDRHHAVDAIIVAAIDQRTLKIATYFAKKNEESGRPRDRFKIDPPWPTMEADVAAAINTIPIVARQRRDAFKGAIHADTIYGVTQINGETHIKERRKVDETLTLEHLSRFKDSSKKGHLKAILEQWVREGHPKDRKPTWKYGVYTDNTERRMPIKKITLIARGEPSVVPARLNRINDTGELQAFGSYDREDMVRIDVFAEIGKSGRKTHVYVPIYPHQMTLESPPNQYVARGVPAGEWPTLENRHAFVASLVKLDLIEIDTSKRGTERVYFRSLHVGKRDIFVSPVNSLSDDHEIQVAYSNLRSLKKLSVDRLGRVEVVESELRTWRGKVCMSASPRG